MCDAKLLARGLGIDDWNGFSIADLMCIIMPNAHCAYGSGALP